jgi:hypothetical protein
MGEVAPRSPGGVFFRWWKPHPGWSAGIPLAGASIIGVDGVEGTREPLGVEGA